jgi:hypothetical protein
LDPSFAVFLRIFLTAFGPIGPGWEPLVWLSALASMKAYRHTGRRGTQRDIIMA